MKSHSIGTRPDPAFPLDARLDVALKTQLEVRLNARLGKADAQLGLFRWSRSVTS